VGNVYIILKQINGKTVSIYTAILQCYGPIIEAETALKSVSFHNFQHLRVGQ